MQARRGAKIFRILSDGSSDGAVASSTKANGCATIPISPSSSSSSLSSLFPPDVNFIEHRVSKMDTLAGIAIKYGVEVADIKRVNGLVTDIQMFAHKSLQIPLPGKHPPSPVIIPNGSTHNGEKTPPRRSHYGILDSLQSVESKPPSRHISPAMCSLQGFYCLTQHSKVQFAEGTEMATHNSGKTLHQDDHKLSKPPINDPILSRHRKSRSLANVTSLENGNVIEDSTDADRSIRRRQKADAEPSLRTPAILLEEESNGGASSGSRMDMEASRWSSSSVIDSLADVFVSVRKSSSTSNLSESESSSFSIWPTSRWSLKTDAIARPIFDGLPKPMLAWRNKAALD